MKWFQHHSDSHTNPKLRQVIRKSGVEGIGFWWVCCELVAKDGDDYRVIKKKDWRITLVEITREKEEFVEDMLMFFSHINLIDKDALSQGDLYIPKMAEYSDDYTKRVDRKKGVSEYSSDSVRQDKIRIDKNRINKKRKEQYDRWFEEFWNKYPRKQAKKKAKQSWDKLTLSKEVFDKIMKTLSLYLESDQWVRDSGKYIPHPATWLNQERWEDEVSKVDTGEDPIIPNYAKK